MLDDLSRAILPRRGFEPAKPLPIAHRLGATSLTFLVHHNIDADSMRRYARLVGKTLGQVADSAFLPAQASKRSIAVNIRLGDLLPIVTDSNPLAG